MIGDYVKEGDRVEVTVRPVECAKGLKVARRKERGVVADSL